jgi:hypothetical protein
MFAKDDSIMLNIMAQSEAKNAFSCVLIVSIAHLRDAPPADAAEIGAHTAATSLVQTYTLPILLRIF